MKPFGQLPTKLKNTSVGLITTFLTLKYYSDVRIAEKSETAFLELYFKPPNNCTLKN